MTGIFEVYRSLMGYLAFIPRYLAYCNGISTRTDSIQMTAPNIKNVIPRVKRLGVYPSRMTNHAASTASPVAVPIPNDRITFATKAAITPFGKPVACGFSESAPM